MKRTIAFFTFVTILSIYCSTLSAQKSGSIELKATIAGFSGGEISKDLLLKNTEILCSDPKFKVVSFNLSLSRYGDVIDFSGTGNKLSDEMKETIKNTKVGNKISIEKIVGKNESGEEIKLPFIILTLK